MRTMSALVAMVLLLAGCSGDDTERGSTTTTQSIVTTTTTSDPVGESTMTAPSTSTSMSTTERDDIGAESIGITDRVTIVITDPEGG